MDLALAQKILRSQNVLTEEQAHLQAGDDVDEEITLCGAAARLVLMRCPMIECNTLPGLYVAPGNTRLGWGVKTNGPWTDSGEIAWAITQEEAEALAHDVRLQAREELRRQRYCDRYEELELNG